MAVATLIKERLVEAFSPTSLTVTDDSDQHIGHAGHAAGGRHFSITISSQAFAGCTRIDAHRKIYAIFTDLMPVPIHALKIQLIQE